MEHHDDVTAGILVGGRGHRLGGIDKARLNLAESSFLHRLVSLMSPRVARVVLLGRSEQRYPEIDLELLCDPVVDGGPLAGLVSLSEGATTPWVFLVACDLPRFEPAVLDRLVAHRANRDEAVVPTTDGQLHPTAALYASGVAGRARERLGAAERRDRSLRRLLDDLETHRVELPDSLAGALYNVNTPGDLAPFQH